MAVSAHYLMCALNKANTIGIIKLTKRQKRLQKLRQSPKDVSFEELRQVLEDHGFVLDHAQAVIIFFAQ